MASSTVCLLRPAPGMAPASASPDAPVWRLHRFFSCRPLFPFRPDNDFNWVLHSGNRLFTTVRAAFRSVGFVAPFRRWCSSADRRALLDALLSVVVGPPTAFSIPLDAYRGCRAMLRPCRSGACALSVRPRPQRLVSPSCRKPGTVVRYGAAVPEGVWSVLLAGAWCRVASCVLQRRCLPICCRAGVRPSRGLCAMRFRFQVARRRRSAGGGSMRSGGRVPSSFGPAGLDAGRRRRRRSFRCGCMATASAGDLPFRGWSASPSVPLGRRRLYRRTALSACFHDLGLCPPCADPFPLQPRLYSVSALALAPFRLASGPFL